MNVKKKNIDRGKFLKQIVEDNGISIVKLIKKIGYKDRASYYTHIAKPDLSLDIVATYAKAINYDLRQDFPELTPFLLEEQNTLYNVTPSNFEEAKLLVEKWKEKYFQLLEKYAKYMEDKEGA